MATSNYVNGVFMLVTNYPMYGHIPNDGNNVYLEVECGGEMKERDRHSKFVCSEITLLKEINTSDVVKFDHAEFFFDEYARVELNDKYNLINRNGELIGNQWYDWVRYFSNGYAVVHLNNKYNFINCNGELISNQWYDWAGDFCEGYAQVVSYGKTNFINNNGKIAFLGKWKYFLRAHINSLLLKLN